jgi:Tfp pilus assembly protein PilO
MSRFSGTRERLFSPVGLHAIAFGILAVATIVLGVRLIMDWRATSASTVDAIAARQLELRMLEVQTAPLRGLDKRVALSREQIDEFYAKRIPNKESTILEQLGQISSKGHVQLSRVQYTQHPGSGDLTEIRMDAGLSGDYAGIMKFINGLERSPTFFVIRAMALTGQQSGTVNLRMQFSTWMRPADAAASGIPIEGSQPADPDAVSPGSAQSGEGE